MSNPTIQARTTITRGPSGRFARIDWTQPEAVLVEHATHEVDRPLRPVVPVVLRSRRLQRIDAFRARVAKLAHLAGM